MFLKKINLRCRCSTCGPEAQWSKVNSKDLFRNTHNQINTTRESGSLSYYVMFTTVVYETD